MKTLSLIAVLAVMVCGSVARAEEDPAAASKLDAALAAMKQQAVALGAPKLDGVALYFGTTKINGNYDIVDGIKDKYACVATFFVSRGPNFIRVSTNVQKEGNRAVGTKLDPSGKAFAAVSKGEIFRGEAMILGNRYLTVYEPLKDDTGRIVGVYFVGFPK